MSRYADPDENHMVYRYPDPESDIQREPPVDEDPPDDWRDWINS